MCQTFVRRCHDGLGSSRSWRLDHPTTEVRLKKRIVRTVIHELIADIGTDAAEIVLLIHWVGGVHTDIRLPRQRRGQRTSTSPDVIAAVRQTGADRQRRSHRRDPEQKRPSSTPVPSAEPFVRHRGAVDPGVPSPVSQAKQVAAIDSRECALSCRTSPRNRSSSTRSVKFSSAIAAAVFDAHRPSWRSDCAT